MSNLLNITEIHIAKRRKILMSNFINFLKFYVSIILAIDRETNYIDFLSKSFLKHLRCLNCRTYAN